jgi:predicted RNA-binding Zn ribbon-like protein
VVDLPARYGGHPVLDLVNTVAWRTDPERRTERLVDQPTLLAWARAVGLVDRRHTLPLGTDADLAAVRRLREAVHAVLVAIVDGAVPADHSLRVIQAAALDAMRHATLTGPGPLRWALPPRQPADLPRALALASLDLLRSPDLRLVRRCEGDGCGWFFLDRSRSHTRRWCSSGDCGNRVRARRHYARTHGRAAG